jgi:hypothetical protein
MSKINDNVSLFRPKSERKEPNCACNVAEICKRWKYQIDESVTNRKIKIEENIKRGSTMT